MPKGGGIKNAPKAPNILSVGIEKGGIKKFGAEGGSKKIRFSKNILRPHLTYFMTILL